MVQRISPKAMEDHIPHITQMYALTVPHSTTMFERFTPSRWWWRPRSSGCLRCRLRQLDPGRSQPTRSEGRRRNQKKVRARHRSLIIFCQESAQGPFCPAPQLRGVSPPFQAPWPMAHPIRLDTCTPLSRRALPPVKASFLVEDSRQMIVSTGPRLPLAAAEAATGVGAGRGVAGLLLAGLATCNFRKPRPEQLDSAHHFIQTRDFWPVRRTWIHMQQCRLEKNRAGVLDATHRQRSIFSYDSWTARYCLC